MQYPRYLLGTTGKITKGDYSVENRPRIGAGYNVEADGYRRGQLVDLEIGEIRLKEPVERCDELVDEVSMATAWIMQSTAEDERYALDDEKWRSR
ncbi:hypothetical protein CEXT_144061 [Caerostris extrusa]|uniref:Uncharacterized protein n=1 Tax=Caerostris extrusa TaxID=172846 RepID=A0AAV4NTT4_CAEEX|nr:hypothetical protein CEXT_144061 [Caerostris extrusa]